MSQIDPSPTRSHHHHLPPLPLPEGITESYVHCTANGLTVHVLEAGYAPSHTKPLLVLLHGYPELAFSWRKVMLPLSEAGYHVVAFDQRGYGRTTGWDESPFAKTDLGEFSMLNLVRDVIVLVNALGYTSVNCVVGHDFGALLASLCGLTRPDFFKNVVIMSHPFKGAPSLPFDTAHDGSSTYEEQQAARSNVHRDLARLPEPRKHYQWYNSTSVAAFQWSVPVQGLETFLRSYIYVKSADYAGNDPHPLEGWTASELARLPLYYLMPLHKSMPETIASMMEEEDASPTERWLPKADLDIYVQEWSRTGFQGGLNWYRVVTDPARMKDLDLFAGAKLRSPLLFLSGAKDWANYQQPGAVDHMADHCTDFKGAKFIEGAGHWPQQEQPETVIEEILAFLRDVDV